MTYFYHFYRIKYKSKCFKNKVIWIVGASSGLGEQIVYESAANDAKCIIISSRRKEQLERVAKAANKDYNANTKIIIVPVDLLQFLDTDNGRKSCEAFVHNVIKENELTNIDVLVMNSGITARALGIKTSLSVFERLMNVNVFGIAVFVQSFVTVLRELHWIKASNTNKYQRSIYITSSIAGLGMRLN